MADDLGAPLTVDQMYGDWDIEWEDAVDDLGGREISLDDPDMGTWTYDHDVFGNLTSQSGGRGQMLAFTYDEYDRLIARHDTSINPPGQPELRPGKLAAAVVRHQRWVRKSMFFSTTPLRFPRRGGHGTTVTP